MSDMSRRARGCVVLGAVALGCGGDDGALVTSASSIASATEPDTITEPDTASGTDTGADSGTDTGTTEGSSTTDSSADGSSSTTPDDSGSTTAADPVCGNDVAEADELCDGDDLAGQDCAARGFDGGVLVCSEACDGVDASGCFSCGDGVAAGPEECDGADLSGNDCATVGAFFGGVLQCDAQCNFDTTACNFCGDGDRDFGEQCDGVDLGGASCLNLGHTGGLLSCVEDCTFDETACTDLPVPSFGDLVISEVMQNPAALADDLGEWFEIHNPGPQGFQLRGCVVEGAGMNESFAINTDLVVGPGAYVTFATDLAPGFTPDFVWGGVFALTNASDIVRLRCAGQAIDEIGYDDGATFPDPNGAAMQLDPDLLDIVANDDGGNWCLAQAAYGGGDLGTPGAANAQCGGVSYPIDFCRLQFPTAIDQVVGTHVDVFGRLFVAGLTDQSGVNDLAPQVAGAVGRGPDGTDPAVDPNWVWTAAVPNAGYGPASPGYEANNDEYQAQLTVPAPGAYDFAFRFSGDGGATFTYCDGQAAGSSDGYAPADAGQLTANPPGPPPNLLFSEYVEGSSNNKALEIYNASADVVDLAACAVRIYFNGNVGAGNTIALAGDLDGDDVFVVCDDDIADASGCDLLATGSFFNGDDAVELRCDGVAVDVIGEVGFDPGAEWIVAGVGTANETLRRDCAVLTGDPDGGDAFDPSVQWATFALDDLSDLGQHACR